VLNISSGTQEASSTRNITWSQWTQARASGLSLRAVFALANQVSGDSFILMYQEDHSK